MLPGVGIIGTGPLAKFMVPLLRRKGFRVEGVWGFRLNQTQSFAEQFNIPFFTDSIDTLLLKRDVQLIVVVCPPHLHSTIVNKSFSIGKHVVCDWTSALTSDEMREMVDKSTYYPALISILCHPLRFLSSFQRVKMLLSNGFVGDLKLMDITLSGSDLIQLGNLYSVSCDHNSGGGLLTTVGSHVIDIISFLTNMRAKRVHGVLKSFNQQKRRSSQGATTPTTTDGSNQPQSTPNQNHHNLHKYITSSPNNGVPCMTTTRFVSDDYCMFQMELEPRRSQTPFSSNNLINSSSAFTSTSSPLATVTLNSNFTSRYRHEIRIHGSSGYLTIIDGKVYGHRSEKENGDDVHDDEEDEEFLIFQESEEDDSDLIDGPLNPDEASILLNGSFPDPFAKGLNRLLSTLSYAFKGSSDPSRSPESASPNPHLQDLHSESIHLGTDSSYSSAASSLNSAEINQQTHGSTPNPTVTPTPHQTRHMTSSPPSMGKIPESVEEVTHWFKEAVSLAANFEDGQYILAVIEGIKESNEERKWMRVKYNTPFSVGSPIKRIN